MPFRTRQITRSAPAFEQIEGINTVVKRSIGHMAKRNFTPFLVFDHFQFKAAQATTMGGFPDHPHRGQETITYLLDTTVGGGIAHEDFMGGKGVLRSGDLQFIVAGRGIVHAEMPVFDDDEKQNSGQEGGVIEGIQLWLDLPENKKESDPSYSNIYSKDVPVVDLGNGQSVKVISGNAFGQVGPATGVSVTPILFLDFSFTNSNIANQPEILVDPIQLDIPENYNAIVYVVSGFVQINTDEFPSGPLTCVLFDRSGDGITISPATAVTNNGNKATAAGRFVVVAGQALDDQAIIQRGPFVATTLERIRETENDFRKLQNGFERMRNWSSDIGKRASRLYRG